MQKQTLAFGNELVAGANRESTATNVEFGLNIINKISNVRFNHEDYNFIPTIKYKKDIEQSGKSLPVLCGFDRFAIAIVWNNKKTWLSNTYNDLAIPYKVYQLHQIDTSSVEDNYLGTDHFFPRLDLTGPIDLLYRKIISEAYNFNNLYTLVRSCGEAHILMMAGTSKIIDNVTQLRSIYKNTFHAFENFAIQFLEEHIAKLVQFNSKIKLLRLYYDSNFRKSVIKRNYVESSQQLTTQEAVCLHWASYGKTADETAVILNISPHTVRQHLKVVIRKLEATNIAHAVFKAKSHGLI